MNSPSSAPNPCPLCLASGQAIFKGYKLNERQGLFPRRTYENAEKVHSCRNCGLIYTTFREKTVFEADDSLLRFVTQSAKEVKAQASYEDTLDFLRNEAGLKAGAKVLDMGSGVGRVAYLLRKEGYETFAVEPKAQLFAYSVNEGLADKERTFNRSFEESEFETGQFDFIFLEPLHHLSEPHAALQKTLRWLKPGGYLHLEVVHSGWLYKFLLLLFYKINFRKHVPYTSAHRKPFNACEYSTRSFRVYARQNNLELCRVKTYACDTHLPNKHLSRWMTAFMERFHCGMELTVLLRKK